MAVSLQFNFSGYDQRSIIPIAVIKENKTKTKEISNLGAFIHYFIAISSTEWGEVGGRCKGRNCVVQ